MYTIGQFSRIGRTPAKTLRFYDEIGLLKPARVDPMTQYRYYSAEQVADILLIGELKAFAFSLDEIKRLLKVKDNSVLKAALTEKMEQLQEQIDGLQHTSEVLAEKIKGLADESRNMGVSYRMEVKTGQPMLSACLRQRISASQIDTMIRELFGRLFDSGLQPVGPLLSIYYDEAFDPEDFEVEQCVPIALAARCSGLDIREVGHGSFATTIHVGPYEKIGMAYAALIEWMAENRLEAAGPAHEWHLVGPGNTRDSGKFVTEIGFPIIVKECAE